MRYNLIITHKEWWLTRREFFPTLEDACTAAANEANEFAAAVAKAVADNAPIPESPHLTIEIIDGSHYWVIPAFAPNYRPPEQEPV